MKNKSCCGKNRLLFGLGLLAGAIAWRHLSAKKQAAPFLEPEAAGTALITGASSGIGAAFARLLAADGYDLVLVARREERLKALAQEMQERHAVRAEVLAADLASPADVDRLEQYVASLDGLSLLINNAGFGVANSFVEAGLERQLDMIHVHVTASVRLSRAALPGLIERGRGGIINVSSVAAFLPTAGNVTYSATKNYLNTFSLALQTELQGSGVWVQSLCPGFTYSEFHDRPGYEEFDRSTIPSFLWMTSEEVAAQSLQNLGTGPVIFVPGWQNRLMTAILRTPVLSSAVRWAGARRPWINSPSADGRGAE